VAIFALTLVYSHPIFIIFGTLYTAGNLKLEDIQLAT